MPSQSLPQNMTAVVRNVQSVLIVRMNNCMGFWRILNFPQLRDMFPYQLARGIPFKEGVQYPLQSKARTPPPHLWWTILALQISLNGWLPLHLLHSKGQEILQPLHRVQAIVAHHHLEEPHRQTQRIMLYPALHPALLALTLLPAVLKTWLPPSLIHKLAQSLQIHCERKLQNGVRNRPSPNCNCGQCLHLDKWSPAVAESIDILTQPWHKLYLQGADSCHSTCRTKGHLWVLTTSRWKVMQCNLLQKD
jgi:hypothetical protein